MFAIHARPSELTAALDEMEQVLAAVRVAYPRVADATMRHGTSHATDRLRSAIDAVRVGDPLLGIMQLTGMEVQVSTLNLAATATGIHCGIPGS